MISDGKYGLAYHVHPILHIREGHVQNGLKPNGDTCLEMLRGEKGPYTSVGGYLLFALYEERPDTRTTTLRKQEEEYNELDTTEHIISIRDTFTIGRHRLPFHNIGQTTLAPDHRVFGGGLFYQDKAFAHLEGQSGPLVWASIPLTALRRAP